MSTTNEPNANQNNTIENRLLYLFTRTPLHVGAGASVGAVDQPIQRERHTGFPVVPGSSIKGVLRAAAERDPKIGPDKAKAIFGVQESAGVIALGEARILAFPVRSARGSFAFITCPLALERLKRENQALSGRAVPPEPADMHCLAGAQIGLPAAKPTGVVLEEFKFAFDGTFPPDWETELTGLLPDDPVLQVGKGRFVLLNLGDFSHFVRNACEVNQHVSIDDDTGTAKGKALFDLEAVPAETLFFAPITVLPRSKGEIEMLEELLKQKSVLQFGGDSTTGLGFCTVKLA